MIRLIEASNFRSLKYIRQSLGSFHVLVGPNASGKTTFLDVVSFLGQLVSDGLEAAIGERTQNFQDLVWARSGNKFELAIEAAIPEAILEKLGNKNFDTIRYEISLGINPETQEPSVLAERVLLKESHPIQITQRNLFPLEAEQPDSILTTTKASRSHTIINTGGDALFLSEYFQRFGIVKGGLPIKFRLGPRRSALGNLPEDETRFPASTWLKGLLTEGVQPFVLNSILIRKASPPGQIRGFKPDGSNLPWVINSLKEKAPARFQDWIAHLQTALPDIENIRTIERPDDKHRYLVICYRGGLEVPSWTASDGTLRLLALTLPAYLPDFNGVYLIEEPENGIHPRAVESMFQSLSSVYDAQILLATHSPVVLSIADVDAVLCFAKTPNGATDIVRGSEHPKLREWREQSETNLGVLFAAGVLG